MKTVKLLALTLLHFKGIKKFELHANGENVQVHGDNAAGKTSLFDAFTWLLFDKDSNNKKDFAIKTLNEDGSPMHNIEHTVEGVFSVDGVVTKFKKVYKEKWTKKRGAPKAEFTGHEMDHFVDDVPMAKGAYTKKVAEIISEDVFKLLTSPTYFNENIKWQDRRKILLEICGDITDEEVIASDKQLSQLNELLSGKTMEDMKKIIASRKKHINDELERIPVRIDELHRSIPETVADVSVAKASVATIEKEIEELKTQRINIKNGAAVGEKRNEIQQVTNELLQVKRDFEHDSKNEVYRLETAIQEMKGNVQITESKKRVIFSEIEQKKRQMQSLATENDRKNAQMDALRNEFETLKKQVFEFEDDCTCPTCKQNLPAEQIEQAKQTAQEAFNLSVSTRKEQIKAEGGRLNQEVQEALEVIARLSNEINNNAELEKLDTQLADFHKTLDKLQKQLETATTSLPDVNEHEPYKALLARKAELEKAVTELEQSAYAAVADLNSEIAQLETKRNELNAEIAAVANVAYTKQRITELEAQQQQLAEEYESFELTDHLIDQFTRKKVDLLSERINAKFKYARFKMFDQQVNGALNEVCETLYEGVPYTTGLNNAARINVGLDIINTLAEHYGLTAPIFIDNAEAVTKFIETNAQMISLIVSEGDKQLRVEYPSKTLEGAI